MASGSVEVARFITAGRRMVRLCRDWASGEASSDCLSVDGRDPMPTDAELAQAECVRVDELTWGEKRIAPATPEERAAFVARAVAASVFHPTGLWR